MPVPALARLPQGSHPGLALPRPLVRLRRPRAIVVDDDEDLRPVFERALRALDPELRVDWALGVKEAVELLRRHDHDLVVADYMLGDGTGFLVKRWIDLRAPGKPFGMVSAYRVRAEGGRVTGRNIPFLPKPFGAAELQRFLEALRP